MEKTSNFRLPCFRYVEALEKLEEQLLDIVERFGKSASTGSGLILKSVKTVTKNKYIGQILLRKSKKKSPYWSSGNGSREATIDGR